jgi:hypothetical protein
MAGTNFDTHAGETFTASFTCLDSAGAAVNLTGYTARAQVRTTPTSSTVLLNLAPTIPTPANGIIRINVATTGITAGIYYWDLVLDLPSSAGTIFITGGTIKFRDLVTRV